MANKKKYDKLVVTGSAAYDEIMNFPGEFRDYFHPEKLHQINVSFALERLERQIGGTGINIAYNASLIIGNSVQLFSSVGKDGDTFLKWLSENNIDASGILKDENLYTASGKVITDKSDNQIWGYYYGALKSASKITLNKNTLSNSLLIISANEPTAFLNFQHQAISAGLDYIYDPGMALTWIKPDDLREGIRSSRYLVGNDYEIAQIIRFSKVSLADLKKRDIAVITTQGSKGVLYQDKKNSILIPAYKVSKLVDPTGAGDAWRAGFAAGLIEGKTLIDSLIQANALASFAVEIYGTVNHKPTRNDIDARVSWIKKAMDI